MNRSILFGRIDGPAKALFTIQMVAALGIIVSVCACWQLLHPPYDPNESVEELRKFAAVTRTWRDMQLLLLGPLSLLFYVFLFDIRKWAFLASIPLFVLLTVLGGGLWSGIPLLLMAWCFFMTDLPLSPKK